MMRALVRVRALLCMGAQVGMLSALHLSELKNYREPPPRVRLVVLAVCLLFDWPAGDWPSAQRLLSDGNPKLMERLKVRAASPFYVCVCVSGGACAGACVCTHVCLCLCLWTCRCMCVCECECVCKCECV